MRRNVDAWWPLVERGEVEAIVMNASGCGVTVREYGHSLAHDRAYAPRARRIGELTKDLSEVLEPLTSQLKARAGSADARAPGERIAFHPPCTLQHGQQLRGGVEAILRELGFDVQLPMSESHLCCGSAGTYSVLQPELAHALRERKLEHLKRLEPRLIVSANIGCIQHLQAGTTIPVRHWIELVDELLG
jgi:glycolate oxidase iron-sulfur subunit